MDARVKKLADALGTIALERKHASGGYLSRSAMAQIARRALVSCELEWPSRHGEKMAEDRQLFFEGSIYVQTTAKDLVIEIDGISHMVDRGSLRLAVSDAVARYLEDTPLGDKNGG